MVPILDPKEGDTIYDPALGQAIRAIPKQSRHHRWRFASNQPWQYASTPIRMVRSFSARPTEFDQAANSRPLECFADIGRLLAELIPGVPDLLARIDLLTTTSDALVITDFKTARSRWSQGQAENSSSQLLLYSELARRLMPDREVRLRFLVLTKTKKPTVESVDFHLKRNGASASVLALTNWGSAPSVIAVTRPFCQ